MKNIAPFIDNGEGVNEEECPIELPLNEFIHLYPAVLGEAQNNFSTLPFLLKILC